MKKPRPILPVRPVGLDPAKTAPYWRGERAEHIVKARVRQYIKEAALKASRRRKKK